ncbi:MAG: hypothetical protein ACFNL3_02870 [Rothia aeria]|uniref:hypothetical protein n=2 Tax=Rothia aeria TaxID=172042 RepID=UPI00241EF693|nr:hypothetical protein [Rothia aeria]
MSRVIEGRKRNFLFIVMLGVILILAILLVWNLMGNKGETKNSAGGVSSSSSAPSEGGQQTSTPPTGRGDHKCDVPVAPDKAFSAELPSDYRFETTTRGVIYPISAQYGPTYKPGVVGYCFAHNPTGAALAASQGSTIAGDTRATEAELRGLYSSRIAADLQYAPDYNAERVHARIAGYDIENYSPEKATIGIVVLTKDSEGKNTGFKILMTVVWEDNDWKVDNNNAENATPLTKEPTYIFKAQGGSQSS